MAGESGLVPGPAKPTTPGYRFKDGRLMIFREDEVMLIRGWEEPQALRKSGGEWEEFRPEFRLVEPYRRTAKPPSPKAWKPELPPGGQMELTLWAEGAPSAEAKPARQKPLTMARQRKLAFDAFRFSLPKEVARALERFRSHQWSLLTLLAQDKQSLDLATANPVLAYAVANWRATRPESRRSLGAMPQRELLKLLRLPDSPAIVKQFRKIPPESVDQRFWPVLLAALRHPDGPSSKLLSHVPAINLGVMELILTPRVRGHVTPSLLAEVAADAKEKYRSTVARKIGDLLAMRDELGTTRPLGGIQSVEQLGRIHGDAMEDFQKLRRMRMEHGAFPLPPVPGVEGKIIPLRTQAELVAEGREQKNCVATYAAGVAQRKCYIYKVLHPRRATLCLRPQPDGNWGISQIEFSCNRQADRTTVAFVQEWLRPYEIGI